MRRPQRKAKMPYVISEEMSGGVILPCIIYCVEYLSSYRHFPEENESKHKEHQYDFPVSPLDFQLVCDRFHGIIKPTFHYQINRLEPWQVSHCRPEKG